MEFFSCWNGGEALPVEKHSWITLQDFLAPEFNFDQQKVINIYIDFVYERFLSIALVTNKMGVPISISAITKKNTSAAS